jgi:ERCC4-type nuclease
MKSNHRKTRYGRLLDDRSELIDFLDSASLGQLLGFSRFLTVEPVEVDTQSLSENPEKNQIFSLTNQMILNELHTRHRRVDHREHREMLTYLSELGFEVVSLDTGKGDVSTRKVSIERKEDDFLPSLFDGRRLKQLGAMREEAEYSYLIVSKSYDAIRLGARDRGVSEQTLIGFIASLCAVGYPPVFIDNRHDASLLIHKIVQKVEDDNPRLYVPRPKSPTPKEYRDALVEGLPKVGAKLRRRIVAKYPTILSLAQTTPEELSSIEGIGLDTAKRILSVLRDESGVSA